MAKAGGEEGREKKVVKVTLKSALGGEGTCFPKKSAEKYSLIVLWCNREDLQ